MTSLDILISCMLNYELYPFILFNTGPDRPVVEVIEILVSKLNSRVEVTCSVQEEARVPPVTFQWTDESVSI